jgi:putative phage-type endonuclease
MKMETHNLVQGSPEWKAHRAKYFNASDAPAMMDCSPYKKRSELIAEIKRGFAGDVDASTQKRFDDGHRFESLARPIAETYMRKELFPLVATKGNLGASFDGIDLLNEEIWEHKTINDAIRNAPTAEELPLYLRVQMEQQLYISGAERCLFTASKFDNDGNLIENKNLWYSPDLALRERIISGWEQFAIDLQSDARVIAEPITVAPIQTLPAVSFQITGSVANSNLPVVKNQIEAFIANINLDLQSDTDFAVADAVCKICEKTEKEIKFAKQSALDQTADISEIFRTLDNLADQLRVKRLDLDKKVDKRKAEIKAKIIADAGADWIAFSNEQLGTLKALGVRIPEQPDFAGAIKGQKLLTSLHEKVDAELRQYKVLAKQFIAMTMINYDFFYKTVSAENQLLFPDLVTLLIKDHVDFKLIIDSRINAAAIAKKNAEIEAAARAEQAVKPVDVPTPIEPVKNAAKPQIPTREDLIKLVAREHKVSTKDAFAWLDYHFNDKGK